MKKKLFMLGLGFCLLAAACSGKNAEKEKHASQSTEDAANPSGNGDKLQDDGLGAGGASQEEADGKGPGADGKDQAEDGKGRETGDASQTEAGAGSQTDSQGLTEPPEVTFKDYSQNINDDESGALMLAVTENCPVITIKGKEDISQKMNMVFEQQHISNQEEIGTKVQQAKDYYKELTKEEAKAWGGFGYGMTYKAVHISTRILSIVAESYDWQGSAHPNTWTSTYCFDVTTGDLLYLADVFKDEAKARTIVERHILDTITKDPYKDGLMDDYESYVGDIMTENTFYLTDKGLTVICNPYMVTTYAVGMIEINVPYEELKETIHEKYLASIK